MTTYWLSISFFSSSLYNNFFWTITFPLINALHTTCIYNNTCLFQITDDDFSSIPVPANHDEDEHEGPNPALTGQLVAVGNIYLYDACPRPNCYYAKLDDKNNCVKCNSHTTTASKGVTAILTIDFGNSNEITGKIFKSVLQQFYFQLTTEQLIGTADEIEDKLLDIMPCKVQVRLNNRNPPCVTSLKAI